MLRVFIRIFCLIAIASSVGCGSTPEELVKREIELRTRYIVAVDKGNLKEADDLHDQIDDCVARLERHPFEARVKAVNAEYFNAQYRWQAAKLGLTGEAREGYVRYAQDLARRDAERLNKWVFRDQANP